MLSYCVIAYKELTGNQPGYASEVRWSYIRCVLLVLQWTSTCGFLSRV